MEKAAAPKADPSSTSDVASTVADVARRAAWWIFIFLLGRLKLGPVWLTGLVVAVAAVVQYFVRLRLRSQREGEEDEDEDGEKELSTRTWSPMSVPLPAWALDPDTQRAEWANSVLAQLWPAAENWLQRTLADLEADPSWSSRLAAALAPAPAPQLNFAPVHLGRVAPRLTGVRAHQAVHRDEIVLDVDVVYAGDADVGVTASFAGVRISASVKNVSFSDLLR